MLFRADFDAAMAASPHARPAALRERVGAAMCVDLLLAQERLTLGEEGIAARIMLWTNVTGEVLADEAAARSELGEAS